MEEIKTTYQSFAEIARIIREGKLGQLHIGDTISTRHTLRDRLLLAHYRHQRRRCARRHA